MSEEFIFEQAEQKKNKLRLLISGPSGSGKTLGALFIAQGGNGRIGVIDTERGSAKLYAKSFDFKTLELNPPYHPERFIEALHAAEKHFDIIVMDSCTHEWDGSGGCLEINENLAASKYRGNTWSAWNEVTPRHRAFLDAINQSPCHIICTARSKTETVQGEDKKVKKIGMKVEQRSGFEYEMTMAFEIDHSTNMANLTKGRLFDAPTEIKQRFKNPHILTKDDGTVLFEWLNTGKAAEITPRPEEPEQQQTAGILELKKLFNVLMDQKGTFKLSQKDCVDKFYGPGIKKMSDMSEEQIKTTIENAKEYMKLSDIDIDDDDIPF